MAKARLIIEQFIEEHQSIASTLQVAVPAAAFPLVIGYKGTKAQEIAQASGAKFDLDRNNEVPHTPLNALPTHALFKHYHAPSECTTNTHTHTHTF